MIYVNDHGEISTDLFRKLEREILKYRNYLLDYECVIESPKKSPRHKLLITKHALDRFKNRIHNIDDKRIKLLFENTLKIGFKETYPYNNKGMPQVSNYVGGFYNGRKFYLALNEKMDSINTILDEDIMKRIRKNNK